MRTIGLRMAAALLACSIGCKSSEKATPIVPPPNNGPLPTDVSFYLTNPDKSALLQKQNVSLLFRDTSNALATITVDDTQTFQSIDGFGYCLTGGSAQLIHALPAAQQDSLLRELFLTDSASIGVSYLRISIGASDLSATTFTYDDMPGGQTDPNLDHFSLAAEQTDLIPILQKILALNPNIKILGSPWSAPLWMKTANSFKGGSLNTAYYGAYAQYFVKYIQGMKAAGITIDAVTPQNEPLNPNNTPSMTMQWDEEANFVKNALGPAFQAAGLSTKIIVYDHNADVPDYPANILKDAAAYPFVDGSAFHLYGGSITALSQLHDAFPDKNIYFTEQWVGGPGNFGTDLQWAVTNLIVGATRNWCRNVLEWNLAADANYGPHTQGGCTSCLGAYTIGSTSATKNVSYYIIAHASKFVRPGSVRIASTVNGGLDNVAFKTPDGKHALVVINNAGATQTFNIKYNGKSVTPTLKAGAVATFIW
jgi:glucosylceramidase